MGIGDWGFGPIPNPHLNKYYLKILFYLKTDFEKFILNLFNNK